MATFREAFQTSKQLLEQNPDLLRRGSIDAEIEQLMIRSLEEVTSKRFSRIDLYTRMAEPFPAHAFDLLVKWSSERSKGIPLQHITGKQTFLEHEYEVNSNVLIPRPETEVLTVTAISELEKKFEDRPIRGLEIGVGSGVISIELLSHFPKLTILATDFSNEALQTARRNADRILGTDASRSRLLLAKSESRNHIFETLSSKRAGQGDEKFHFIISNPPYLLPGTKEAEPEVVKYEPALALFAPEEDPLYFYRAIAEQGTEFLEKEGIALMEMPSERSGSIKKLFQEKGWRVRSVKDLASRERVLIAERKEM